MSPSPLQARANAAPAAPVAAPQPLAPARRAPAVRLAASAVTLLTAAMFTNSAIYILGTSRASMLVVEYLVWFVAAIVIRTQLRTAPLLPLRSPVRKGMIAFMAALALSTLCIWIVGTRADFDRLFPQVAALLYMALPFFVFDAATKAMDMERVVLLTCHVILALCMISILGDFLGFTDYENGGGRYFGFLSDPVAWALTVPFVIYFSSNRVALAALTGLGLALTGSRAPAICSATALLLLIAFSRGRRIQYFVTLALLLVLAAYQSDIFQTLASRIEATRIGSNDRLGTALLGLKIFDRSPYFGMGYNSFSYLYSRRFTNSLHEVLFAQTSTFVQMLSDGGLLLFLGYIAFVIMATRAGIALMKQSKTTPHSGVINGVAAWLIVMLWVNQSATWFIVGSYFGPLVLGLAGIVSGYFARLLLSRAHQQSLASRPAF